MGVGVQEHPQDGSLGGGDDGTGGVPGEEGVGEGRAVGGVRRAGTVAVAVVGAGEVVDGGVAGEVQGLVVGRRMSMSTGETGVQLPTATAMAHNTATSRVRTGHTPVIGPGRSGVGREPRVSRKMPTPVKNRTIPW